MLLTSIVTLLCSAEPNAVQAEMQLLNQAVVTTLIGIGAGNVDAVPAAFEKLHEAKEATEKALESGAWKPKSGTTVAAFKKQDQAFHLDLEKLVKAAAKKDVAATAKQLGAVVNGCPACHDKFRAPPAPAAP